MKFVDRLVDWVIAYRNVLLIGSIALVLLAIYPSTQLKFERNIENLFRPDDPRYEGFQRDKQLFGGIESAILAYDDAQLFSQAGLGRLEQLKQQVLALPGVERVACLNDVRRPTAPFDGRSLREQLQAGTTTSDALRDEILGTDLYRGRLVTVDGKTALLLIDLVPVHDDQQIRTQTVRRLQEISGAHDPPGVVAGGPILVEEIYNNLERDGVLLGLASSLILTLVIAAMFRSIRWTLLPLAIVQVALVWTKAILSLSGARLSMVSAPLVAMITVIGVATAIHVILRYREEAATATSVVALRKTLHHMIPAVFWTCLTTAAGFAALLVCSIVPIQTFATMMSLGSILVFVATLCLVPAAALLFRINRPPMRRELPGQKTVTRFLGQLAAVLKRYPWPVALAAALLLGLCLMGVTRLGVATEFTDNFRSSSPTITSYVFLKDRLESLNAVDVLVPLPPTESREFNASLAQMRELQDALNEDQDVVGTMSVIDMLDFIEAGRALQQPTTPRDSLSRFQQLLPRLDQFSNLLSDRAKLVFFETLEPDVLSRFWNRQETTARIIVQLQHIDGSDAKQAAIQRVAAVSKQSFPDSQVAGFFVLITYVVQSLLADQWVTFGLSIAAIFIIMAIAFRSFGLSLAALVPNAAPILMVIGAMGWLNFEINIATAMMASVSMGLSVDFSIHYLFRFQSELRQGRGFFDAISAAHASVGVAMVVASLALIAGFLVLTLSSLIPSVHFGVLVSVAMLGGLIGNVVVLPLILRVFWNIGLVSNRSAAAA